MAWFWLALSIALMVVELSTVELVSVWFSVGAGITALVKAIFPTVGIGWQILIFVCVSVVLLVSTRPIVKKFLNKRKDKSGTNLELLIGKSAIVVEDIDNILGKGAVKINGLEWSARSCDGSVILKDTVVIFKEISGNKAVVERKGE